MYGSRPTMSSGRGRFEFISRVLIILIIRIGGLGGLGGLGGTGCGSGVWDESAGSPSVLSGGTSKGDVAEEGSSSSSTGGVDGSESSSGTDGSGSGEASTGEVNCDGSQVFYLDADGDDFGDPEQPSSQCPPPPDHVLDFSDCDDSDANRHPDAVETCDGVDEDCDGVPDDPSPENTSCGGCELRTFMGRGYWFCTGATTFDGARSQCESKGVALASVHGAMEQDYLRLTTGSLAAADWWIGLTDSAAEGSFTWVDGSALDYTNWDPGEPNDDGTEDCVELHRSASSRWNDTQCQDPKPFICRSPS